MLLTKLYSSIGIVLTSQITFFYYYKHSVNKTYYIDETIQRGRNTIFIFSMCVVDKNRVTRFGEPICTESDPKKKIPSLSQLGENRTSMDRHDSRLTDIPLSINGS